MDPDPHPQNPIPPPSHRAAYPGGSFRDFEAFATYLGVLRESQFPPKLAMVAFLELVAIVEETLLMGVPFAIRSCGCRYSRNSQPLSSGACPLF
jgi:hypothetical protein